MEISQALQDFLHDNKNLILDKDYVALFAKYSRYARKRDIEELKTVLTAAKIKWQGVDHKPKDSVDLMNSIIKIFIDNSEYNGPFADDLYCPIINPNDNVTLAIESQSGIQTLTIFNNLKIRFKFDPDNDADEFENIDITFSDFTSFLDFVAEEIATPWYDYLDEFKKLV